MPSPVQFRIRINRALISLGFSPDWFLVPLAAIVGILSGLVAIAFDAMVHTSGSFFFGTSWTGRTFITGLILLLILPTIGGLAVGFIQYYIARKPPGHGIPDVIEALARRRGKLKGSTGLFTAINSSLTIGSGGSAGVEAPIVQIGSVLGSVIGQLLRLSHQHMNTLVGCGAAAGLASIFNAPIAGVIFVLEVMLRDFSLKTFIPIVIASVFGVAVTQALLGQNEAIFTVPAAIKTYHFAFSEIGLYFILGILCGLVGWLFTKSLFFSERQWHRLPLHPALKPAAGGLLLGILGVIVTLIFNQPIPAYQPPPFYGNGYPVIEPCFNPAAYLSNPDATSPLGHLSLALLLAALLGKIIGTSLTLGSGGSGGIFAPSLFMGATLGGAFGLLAQHLPYFSNLTPATYALAGMAGVLAGCVHCPLTAFLLVFEITQNYMVVLPVMLVAILATTVSQLRLRDSIYTLALRERGIRMGVLGDLTLLRRMHVEDIPLDKAPVVHCEEPLSRLIELAHTHESPDFVVTDDAGCYLGLVAGADVRTALLQPEAVPLMIVGELARTELPAATLYETLDVVLDKFARHDVSSLAVVDDENQVHGLITRTSMIRHYHDALDSDG
jgi:CIC family chloride channel protein